MATNQEILKQDEVHDREHNHRRKKRIDSNFFWTLNFHLREFCSPSSQTDARYIICKSSQFLNSKVSSQKHSTNKALYLHPKYTLIYVKVLIY